LIDIETDERDWYAFLNLSRFLEYRGVSLTADELRWLWFEKVARQTAPVPGRYPEFDARATWREILTQNSDPCRYQLELESGTFLSDITTLHRALTRRTLRLIEGTRTLLDDLQGTTRLGIVSDSQPDYIEPELVIVNLRRHFDTVVSSGMAGYRKPDPRLIRGALDILDVRPDRAVFVGCDTERDIAGAAAAGLHTVLVLTPYGSKDIALGNPDRVVDHLSDVAAAVDDLLDQ
jgi:putative hydrolase of the HAD superfamily